MGAFTDLSQQMPFVRFDLATQSISQLNFKTQCDLKDGQQELRGHPSACDDVSEKVEEGWQDKESDWSSATKTRALSNRNDSHTSEGCRYI